MKPRVVLIEDAASGQSLIQELKNSTALPVKRAKIDRDNVSRPPQSLRFAKLDGSICHKVHRGWRTFWMNMPVSTNWSTTTRSIPRRRHLITFVLAYRP